jgi:hypothetical protein
LVVSGQVSSVIQRLARVIDELELPVDGGVLTEAFALIDRLNAKLLAAVGEHDAAELWREDGATSMTVLHAPCWHAKLLPDNTLEVNRPTGHVHTGHPPTHRQPLPLRE